MFAMLACLNFAVYAELHIPSSFGLDELLLLFGSPILTILVVWVQFYLLVLVQLLLYSDNFIVLHLK